MVFGSMLSIALDGYTILFLLYNCRRCEQALRGLDYKKVAGHIALDDYTILFRPSISRGRGQAIRDTTLK